MSHSTGSKGDYGLQSTHNQEIPFFPLGRPINKLPSGPFAVISQEQLPKSSKQNSGNEGLALLLLPTKVKSGALLSPYRLPSYHLTIIRKGTVVHSRRLNKCDRLYKGAWQVNDRQCGLESQEGLLLVWKEEARALERLRFFFE